MLEVVQEYLDRPLPQRAPVGGESRGRSMADDGERGWRAADWPQHPRLQNGAADVGSGVTDGSTTRRTAAGRSPT
jgi:hypothetical protein